MFNKKIKIEVEEFKTIVKNIELEAKKEQEKKTHELKNRYFNLKDEYEGLQRKYIKIQQEKDILKAKIEEIYKKQEEETLNTLGKYKSLDNF